MLDAIEPIAIVFGTICLGFLCMKSGKMTEDQLGGLVFFAMTIALPCLIIRSFLSIDLGAVFDPDIYLAYYSAAGLIFFTGWLVALKVMKTSGIEAGLYGMSASFCNHGFIGLPVVGATWGEPGVAILALIISIHPATMFTLTITTIELNRGEGRVTAKRLFTPLRGLVKNPIILAVVTGALLSAIKVPVPELGMTFLQTMALAAGPCALFCVGAFLADAKLSAMGRSVPHAVLKTVIMPLVTFVIGHQLFGLELWTALVVAFVSGLPAGANVVMLSHYYHTAEKDVSSVVSLTTLIGMGTLPLMLWIFALVL